jgi:hypothetical protein
MREYLWSSILSIDKTHKHEVRVHSPDQRRRGTKDNGNSPLTLKLLSQGKNNPSSG